VASLFSLVASDLMFISSVIICILLIISVIIPFSHYTPDSPLEDDDVKKTLLSKKEEVDALQDKRLELELQKKEFEDFRQC
jgi:hypothetical protein